MTAAARQAFWDSFEYGHKCILCEAVLIDQSLPERERRRQAAALRAVHFSRMGRKPRRAASAKRTRR